MGGQGGGAETVWNQIGIVGFRPTHEGLELLDTVISHIIQYLYDQGYRTKDQIRELFWAILEDYGR